MAEPLLQVEGLSAGYGRGLIISGIDLCVGAGEWLGLLGANGSGKSTFLRAISGQIPLMAGRVRIGGIDLAAAPEAAKRLFGYAVDDNDLPGGLTGQQYLELTASIRGCTPRSWFWPDLLDQLALAPWMQRPIAACSMGTRMKLSVAGAMLGMPPLLILDESLNGLDPVASYRLRRMLGTLVDSGRFGVVLSTHVIETIGAHCTNAVFLEAGTIAHSWSGPQFADAAARPGGFEVLVMGALGDQV